MTKSAIRHIFYQVNQIFWRFDKKNHGLIKTPKIEAFGGRVPRTLDPLFP